MIGIIIGFIAYAAIAALLWYWVLKMMADEDFKDEVPEL